MDWNFWRVALVILGFVFNIAILLSVKFNDLKHLAIDVASLCTRLNNLEKETRKQGERISKIEGKLER